MVQSEGATSSRSPTYSCTSSADSVQELECQNHLEFKSLEEYTKSEQVIFRAAAVALHMSADSLLVAAANYRSALKRQNVIISLPTSDSQYLDDKIVHGKTTAHFHLSPLYSSKSGLPETGHDDLTVYELPNNSQLNAIYETAATYRRSDHYEPAILNQITTFDLSGCEWDPALATPQFLTGRLSHEHAQDSTSWVPNTVANETIFSISSTAGTENNSWPNLNSRHLTHQSAILQLPQGDMNQGMELQFHHYLEADAPSLNNPQPLDTALRLQGHFDRRDRDIQMYVRPDQRSSPILKRSTTRKRRRGPYQDSQKRKETGLTRKIGACIQCQMQRIRVSL
jgi:hypothetical protein